MVKRLVAVSGLVMAIVAAGGGAAWMVAAQGVPPEGSFVRAADGTVYVVSGGVRFGLNIVPDAGGFLAGLREGPMVGTVRELNDAIAASAAGTRENPLPIGVAYDFPDGWRLRVLSVNQNATAEVTGANPGNPPPDAGYQYLIATIEVTRVAETRSDFYDASRLRALGEGAEEVTTFTWPCPAVPNEFSANSTVRAPLGTTVRGNVCFHVLSSDLPRLVLFDRPAGFLSDIYPYDPVTRVHFTLVP